MSSNDRMKPKKCCHTWNVKATYSSMDRYFGFVYYSECGLVPYFSYRFNYSEREKIGKSKFYMVNNK